ncbi:MAG: hypothetical protein IJO93_05960 [Clostridia bacterium]|nr:hypothetical protein [Clostridia bacterium]
MKTYTVRDITCSKSMKVCDMMLNRMAKEGFELSCVKPWGVFCFEYNENARKYRYFAFRKNRKTDGIASDLRRIFNVTESVRKGSGITVYRLEKGTDKVKMYLDREAKRYGLCEYDPDSFLFALQKKRDMIMLKEKLTLIITFYVFSIIFSVFGALIAMWGFALALVPFILATVEIFNWICIKKYSQFA